MNDATPPKFAIEKGLTRRQKSALKKAPPAGQIKTRKENDVILTYLEGWHVIAEANRIFGPENWDRITHATQCVWQGKHDGQPACAYIARVRITIRAGLTTLTREGSGFGEAIGNDPGDSHGRALKAAETDATKRALATLGAPFGLELYDKNNPLVKAAIEAALACEAKADHRSAKAYCTKTDETQKRNEKPWITYGATGDITGAFRDPILCCSALRRVIEGAQSAGELEAVYALNKRTLSRLVAERPDLRSDANQHYASILSSLFQARLKRYAMASQ